MGFGCCLAPHEGSSAGSCSAERRSVYRHEALPATQFHVDAFHESSRQSRKDLSPERMRIMPS
jgi:hypothetical protein